MEREKAIEMVKRRLAGPRFEHTLRVAGTAVELADRFGADREKAETAALFHDYAKTMPIAELKDILIRSGLDPLLLSYHPELWHGPAASVLVREEAGIKDEEIRNAIYYHTTGRADMTLLEKIVYLADYIEPGRDFPGVGFVRELAEKDLEAALLQALANTVGHLSGKHAAIFPDTFNAYNSLIMNKGGSSI